MFMLSESFSTQKGDCAGLWSKYKRTGLFSQWLIVRQALQIIREGSSRVFWGRKSNTMDGEHSRGRLQGWIVCLCMEYDRQIPPGLAQPLHDCRYEKSPEEVASLPFAHYSVHYSNIVVGGVCPAQSVWLWTRRRGMRWLNEDRHGRERSCAKRRTSTNFYMSRIFSGHTLQSTEYMLGEQIPNN